MPKITCIKDKILQLEGGAFQELCDAYLARKGYEKPFQLGMKSGTMKTTKGNPDTYFRSKSDKYIFVAYTTEKINVDKKIEKDILKCLDKDKTGVENSEIEEIICCHTSSTLNAGDDMRLRNICEEKGIHLDLYGIDRIANDLYQYYPVIAKDFLGVAIDTGQITRYKDFIGKNDSNGMAASLDTKFQFRDDELGNLLGEIERNKSVIVFGKPGVGKTRLVLEACNIFSAQNGYEFFCIKSNDLPIYDDLMTYIQPAKKYLLFIDDANELHGIRHVLELINMKENDFEVKLAITVRDYAKKHVIEDVSSFTNPVQIYLEKFTDDEIKEFLKINMGILNEVYLEQIIKISEGNPRIAFLAGKLAKDKQSLNSIKDVSQLYENYYSRYLNKNVFEADKTICAAAGIIALFNSVDLENLDRLNPVFEMLTINQEQFIDSIEYLHEIEYVEIHYDRVAKISDQCLANYALYFVFFVKKTNCIFEFTKLWI